MSNSVESLRSSYENDNEWSLRKKFLESNRDKLPLERLLCLSMCYINHVSYGVSYSPGVMFKLKEMSQGLPSHLDIVKEKNSIAFVKPTVEKSKYGNFVFSSEASFPKTVLQQPGAGLGFASSSSSSSSSQTDAAKSSFSANSKPNTNANKYPGFVKSGSTASENSKPCFAPATETASDMLQYSGFVKPVSNVSPTQNSNTFYNSDKYMNLAKPNSNPYFGGQPNPQSAKYRSRPLLKGPPESKRPMPANTITKKTFLTATSEAASNSLQDTSEIEVSYREKKFYALSESLKGMKGSPAAVNAIQKLNMAITKVKMFVQTEISPFVSRSSTVFKCRVKIADVQVGEGEGSNKKAAKHEAFSRALSLLAQPTLKIQEQNGRQVLVGSNVPRPHLSRMTLLKSDDPPAAASNNNANAGRKRPMSSWGHFLIMEHKLVNNAIAVIRHSADINRMPIEYVFTPDPQGTSCQLFINDEPIMECVAESKPVAKMEVSEKALQWLKERCWTIMVKQEADSDNIDVSRDEIMGEIEKQFKPIPSDNVGNQLLRKMGWEGGGIGAEGNKGIADPIMVNQVIDRQGLGCRTSAGVSTKFDTFVREILLNYVKSKKQKDLVFTAEFSREERAIIHKEARRYNLKSISRGTGEDRYLIISRKRSAGQLFNHILASGGSTQKYELIPPLKKDP